MAFITLRSFRLSETSNLVFTYSDEVWARLATTCFRREPQNRPLAGRIFLWDSLAQMFRNDSFAFLMAEQIKPRLDKMPGKFWNGYLTLKYSQLVGWVSCASRQNFLPNELCDYAPSKNSTCLMVSRDSAVVASLTDELTFSLVIERWSLGAEVKIHALYPGPNFGQLKGDVTARTGLVLFHREHPGEDISTQTAE